MTASLIIRTDRERLLRQIVDASEEYVFNTFVIGIERPRDYRREVHEAAFRSLKIFLGSRLCSIWPERDVDFDHPEVRLEVRSSHDGIRVTVIASPLFIGGRYRKLSREIPACRWMHLRCKGRGCPSCNHTGNLCGPSIQELAEPAVLAATGGEATFFHGAGREDVDARMLGRGRPFVVEVRQPKKRKIDFGSLTQQINEAARDYAEVHCLTLTGREGVVAAKSATADKTYRVRIRLGGPIPEDIEKRVGLLSGQEIEQLSPTRVMKRRGRNTLRRKRVIESSLIDRQADEIVWEVRVTSGTYVKELISSDEGRTRPSVTSLVGVPCQCVALDVLEVHWEPPWETASGTDDLRSDDRRGTSDPSVKDSPSAVDG